MEGVVFKNEFKSLELDFHDGLLQVSIARPEVLNALNFELLNELGSVFRALEGPRVGEEVPVRAVVIRGGGERAFAAGADIGAMVGMSSVEARQFSRLGHDLARQISAASVPVIAAVQGYALGGGFELALACDFIYAGRGAQFGFPEVSLGVIPGFGGTQRLARRVGLSQALELVMSGRIFSAEEAERLGVVNRVVEPEDVFDAVCDVAQRISVNGPLAVALAKDVLHRGAELPLSQANALEVDHFSSLFSTEDQREGMRAFLVKQKPRFCGQ